MKNQNSQSKPRYKFYATLLDAFHYYLRSEAENAFQEFIDKINRVPFTSEAAEKGTCFNELVDMLADNRYDEACAKYKIAERALRGHEVLTCTHTDRTGNEWVFDYKKALVWDFAYTYAKSNRQIYTSGHLGTSRGTVELYGYIDELALDTVVDIKTTSKYEFPKFLHNYQHLVYPFTLRQEGLETSSFRYHITDFTNTYIEDYSFDEERDVKRLKAHVEHLIDFIETYRHLITDKKIFAMEGEEVTVNG
ncbi:hypothetical protein BCY91_14005 [Pelobium manganitolerans]|uniref:PD-(D/E)XK endonuclease-like domain-containing protein n=1 Tax=Pelobium manganitolerans TaxID=1842495 RepID=A0A419S9X3_9SPHI|nr:HNH endonuclease [Pelobium manganitolerans]RKD18986.1 hypothetical protein BCY91_14005 [Pelobium manganitolerans]